MALVLVMLMLPVLCAGAGVSARSVADAMLPAVCAAVAVARFGCFLHGCCFGAVSRGTAASST